MIKELQAIYENGVFRPLQPVDLREHQHVSIIISGEKKKTNKEIMLAGIEEFLVGEEFYEYCKKNADDSASLEEVRKIMAKIPGQMSDDIIQD